MDIGRLRLQISRVFSGDIEPIVRSHALAFGSLSDDLAFSAGIATMTCSAIIATGQAVNLFNGALRLADAATAVPAIGICVAGAAIGKKARFIIGSGFASKLSGLTANSSVYLGNAGALVFVKPGAGFIQGLGYALSVTEMFVTISQP